MAKVRVPAVGDIREHPRLSIIDAAGREVEILTIALTLISGKAYKTRKAYAKAMLRMCRFLWALGWDPEHVTPYEYRTYRRWLQHCQGLPADPSAPKVNSAAWKRDTTARLAWSTVDQAEAAARTLYRALEDEEYIDLSPVPAAAGLQALKGSNPLEQPRFSMARRGISVGPISKRQEREIKPLPADLQEVLLDDGCPRNAVLWRMMMQSGPRINEIRSLTPERMFLSENYISVIGKGLGGGTRWVPITDEAVDAFGRYQEFLAKRGVVLQDGVSVWRSVRRPHGPISYEAVYQAFKDSLGNDRDAYTPHALRHTAATTMLYELGLQVDRVQKILGHKYLASTQVYLHADLTRVTKEFTDSWRRGRTRPRLDISDLYEPALLADLRAVLDD